MGSRFKQTIEVLSALSNSGNGLTTNSMFLVITQVVLSGLVTVAVTVCVVVLKGLGSVAAV